MTLSLPCLPLIERELRVALRKKRPVRRRLVTASLSAGGACLCLTLGGYLSPLFPAGSAGAGLHKLLCLAGLYVVSTAPALVAGAFANERQEQTLGLLFLSGLSATEVFASKALSAVLVAGTDLFALFPMLALPFLVGGVSWDVFTATVLTLPSLLVLGLAITLLASVLTTDEGAALAVAALVAAILCAGPVAIHFAQARFSGAAPAQWWLRLSPVYMPWLIWNGRAPRRELWSGLGLVLAWSGLGFAAAAAALKRLWRQQEQGGATAGWRGGMWRLVHGGPRRRHTLAAQWLDRNPFVWLAARDGQSTFLAWAVVGVIIAAWLGCWAVWGARWPSLLNLLFSLALLNAAFRWVIFYAAAKALAGPRRDGSFELLLTTRLEPSDLVEGGFLSLNVQFRRVGRCILALEAVLLAGGLATRHWTVAALFVYSVGAAALLVWAWPVARGRRPSREGIPGVIQGPHLSPGWQRAATAMWAGLNSGRPAFAVWHSAGTSPWIWVLNLYNFYMFGFVFRTFADFPTGSPLQVKVAAAVAAFLVLAVCAEILGVKANPAGNRLIGQFRDVVREPLPDRDDPAFKQWKVWERLPYHRKVPWYLRRIG